MLLAFIAVSMYIARCFARVTVQLDRREMVKWLDSDLGLIWCYAMLCYIAILCAATSQLSFLVHSHHDFSGRLPDQFLLSTNDLGRLILLDLGMCMMLLLVE